MIGLHGSRTCFNWWFAQMVGFDDLFKRSHAMVRVHALKGFAQMIWFNGSELCVQQQMRQSVQKHW